MVRTTAARWHLYVGFSLSSLFDLPHLLRIFLRQIEVRSIMVKMKDDPVEQSGEDLQQQQDKR